MNINLFSQYYSLLKSSNFGLSLDYKAILNYVIYTCFKANNKIELFPTPPVIFIFATRRCNLRCNFCSVGANKQNMNEYDLLPKKYCEILKHPIIKKSLLINFLGGEPLLNDSIGELIYITKKHKKFASIITNGLLLKDKWDEIVRANIDDIQVSIYNNTVNCFGNTLKLINNKKKLNASYVLLKSDLYNNKNIIEQVIDFVAYSNFKSLKINFCIPTKFNNFINEYLTTEDETEYNNFKNKILKKYKNIKIFFPKIQNFSKHFKKKCKIPWSILHLDACGNYGFCCKYQPDINANNNIFKRRWEEVINSEYFYNIRKELLSNDDNIPVECQNCYHLIGSYSSNI